MIFVAVGVIQRDGKVLVCQRKRGSRYELKWELPGGKVEENEDAKASLRRELYEELNITAEIGGGILRQHWVYPDNGEFEIEFFIVNRFSGELENRAFEEIRWISPEELAELDLLEGTKEIVNDLNRLVGKG